jgi:hypothetical protein
MYCTDWCSGFQPKDLGNLRSIKTQGVKTLYKKEEDCLIDATQWKKEIDYKL